MRLIGIDGGHTIYELGPVSDVVLFFDCLDLFVVKEQPEKDWSLLTDRLYRRYLKMDELESAAELMEFARKVFLTLPASSVEWDYTMQEKKTTWLDPSRNNLGEIFVKYFDTFLKARESAIYFYNRFGIYQVLKIVPSNIPHAIIEKMRPEAEYDALDKDAKPFWLRDKIEMPSSLNDKA